MSMVINTNLSSLTAQRHLASSRAEMETAMERLSSGKRINSAGDDAAGLTIAHQMDNQIASLNQATRNANDGIAMINLAEGAMDQFSAMLTRMKELATQAANGIYSDSDRANLDKEFQALSDEITRIADVTVYNGQNVLNEGATTVGYQVGDKSSDKIDVTYKDMRADVIGTGKDILSSNATLALTTRAATSAKQVSTYTLAAATSGQVLKVSINGKEFSQDYVTSGAATAAALATKINDELGADTVVATSTAATNLTLTGYANNLEFEAGNLGVFTKGKTGTTVSSYGDVATTTAAASSTAQVSTVTYTAPTTGQIAEITVEGKTFSQKFDTDADTTFGKLISKVNDALSTGGANTVTATYAANVVTLTAIKTDGSTIDVNGGRVLEQGGIATASLSTAANALAAMSSVDTAINMVDTFRSDLGAKANQLEHTASNLMTRVEYTSAARSRIMDADYATESANLAKAQVLQQAGTAMLAQANASTQNVLSLLK